MRRISFLEYFLSFFFVLLIIFDIILFISLFLNVENSILLFSVPILTSVIISLMSPVYRYIYKRPNLILDLEDSRHFLIDVFDTESAKLTKDEKTRRIPEAVTVYGDEKFKERSKYIRINLVNKGKKTAEKCSIKLHIFYSDYELVHEPTHIYPAGHHLVKNKRELPPLINIAAGDSQIFDICSSNNRTGYERLLRFEDHFSHSRIEAQNKPLFLGTYYIKLFVYSDNNSPIEGHYMIYQDPLIKAGPWQKINIKEVAWEKIKKHKEKVKKFYSWINKLKNSSYYKNITKSRIFKWMIRLKETNIHYIISQTKIYRKIAVKFNEIVKNEKNRKRIIIITKIMPPNSYSNKVPPINQPEITPWGISDPQKKNLEYKKGISSHKPEENSKDKKENDYSTGITGL